jgi:hypothetical protein
MTEKGVKNRNKMTLNVGITVVGDADSCKIRLLVTKKTRYAAPAGVQFRVSTYVLCDCARAR